MKDVLFLDLGALETNHLPTLKEHLKINDKYYTVINVIMDCDMLEEVFYIEVVPY